MCGFLSKVFFFSHGVRETYHQVLNDERLEKGLSPLRTAMDVLIEAMNSDELELKEKAKIAEKLATFESSRAPIISIEHVQNISKEEEVTADEALDDFLQSLRKV